MKTNLRIVTAVFAVIALAAAPACQRRPLFQIDNSLRLELVIHDTIAPVPLSVSEGMWMHRFCDRSSGRTVLNTYTGAEGGMVEIPAGRYSVVSNVFGTETVLFDGEGSFSGLKAYTNVAVELTRSLGEVSAVVGTKAPQLPVASGEVVWEPDPLYAAVIEDAEIPFRDPDEPEITLRADAWPMVRNCRIVVRGASGQQHLSQAACFLSGVARGRYLGNGELLKDPVSLGILLKTDPQADSLQADFRSFGFVDGVPKPLYVMLTDTGGGRYLFPFDVTGQCENGEKPLTIYVDLDFEIPEPSSGGGGLAPSLEDWNVVFRTVSL